MTDCSTHRVDDEDDEDDDSEIGDLEMAITRSMKRKVDDDVSDDDSDSNSTPKKRPRSSNCLVDETEELDDIESDRESLSSSATSIASLGAESMDREPNLTSGVASRFAANINKLARMSVTCDGDSDEDTAAETDDAMPSTSGHGMTSVALSKNAVGCSSSNDRSSGDTNQGPANSGQTADDDDATGPANNDTAIEREAGPSTSAGGRRKGKKKPEKEESDIKKRLRPRPANLPQEPRPRVKRPNRRFAQRVSVPLRNRIMLSNSIKCLLKRFKSVKHIIKYY